MDINKVYNTLSYMRINEDIKQDIVLKVYEAREQYDESIASLSAWVTQIAKNHIISLSRSTEYKNEYSTTPLSDFNTDGEYSTIDAYITDNSFSPLDEAIYQDEKDRLLKRIYELDDNYKNTILTHMTGGTTNSVTLHRARKVLEKGPKRKLKLKNTETNEEYIIKTYTEAAVIAGVTGQTVANAVMKNGLFKNNLWKIVVL